MTAQTIRDHVVPMAVPNLATDQRPLADSLDWHTPDIAGWQAALDHIRAHAATLPAGDLQALLTDVANHLQWRHLTLLERSRSSLPVHRSPGSHEALKLWIEAQRQARRARATAIAEGVAAGTVCGFNAAWSDRCGALTPCARHAERHCQCGAPALGECSDYGSFGMVCGADTCGRPSCRHPHRTIARPA